MAKQTVGRRKHPPVLIVIPTLGDRPDLLGQTLESLAKQESGILDIVVVCPRGSRANQLAKKFDVNIAHDRGGGISSALNIGFKQAKPWHKYGGWMGDDDLLRLGSLSKTVSALESDPKAVLAFGYCDYIDDNGRTLFTSRAGRLAPWMMRWGPNLLPLPGLLYRLTFAKEAGKYDESLKYSMDLDMWLRLRKYGRFINTYQTLGAFRWHSSSTTVANRNPSLKESEMVKRRYMSKPVKAIAPIWEVGVRIATRLAVRRVNSLTNG